MAPQRQASATTISHSGVASTLPKYLLALRERLAAGAVAHLMEDLARFLLGDRVVRGDLAARPA